MKTIVTVTHISPSHLDVRVGIRSTRVDGEANIGRTLAPYFVYSDSIRQWLPPHEQDPLSAEDNKAILDAICLYLEQKGMAYVVNPTDDQYRTL
jgi:hypothetical protein